MHSDETKDEITDDERHREMQALRGEHGPTKPMTGGKTALNKATTVEPETEPAKPMVKLRWCPE